MSQFFRNATRKAVKINHINVNIGQNCMDLLTSMKKTAHLFRYFVDFWGKCCNYDIRGFVCMTEKTWYYIHMLKWYRLHICRLENTVCPIKITVLPLLLAFSEVAFANGHCCKTEAIAFTIICVERVLELLSLPARCCCPVTKVIYSLLMTDDSGLTCSLIVSVVSHPSLCPLSSAADWNKSASGRGKLVRLLQFQALLYFSLPCMSGMGLYVVYNNP